MLKTKTAAYKTKTKTIGSKQRHFADLTFKQANATVDLHSSDVLMFQAQNRKKTINSTRKVAMSFKIIRTTSVTRPCFTTQQQTCKTKTKTDVLVSDRPALS